MAVVFALFDDFAGILGIGTVGFVARKDDGGGIGTNEPGDAPYVDIVWRVLFGYAVSRGDSANRQGIAADSRN